MPKLIQKALDNKAIADALKAGVEKVYRDAEVRGLGLKVLASGDASWQIEYRFEGVGRKLKIGSLDALSLKQARDLAREKLGQVANNVDPGAPVRMRKDSATVAELCDTFLEKYGPEHYNKDSLENCETAIRVWIKPLLGRKKLTDVSYDDILAMKTTIAAGKPGVDACGREVRLGGRGAANNSLRIVRAMFDEARLTYRLLDPKTPNPGADVSPFSFAPRKRRITDGEAKAILGAVDRYADRHPRSWAGGLGIRLILLSGLRRGEIENALVENITFLPNQDGTEECDLFLAKTKSGRKALGTTGERTVHFGVAATKIIRTLLARSAGSPWLVPSTKRSQPCNLSNAWKSVLDMAGIAHGPEDNAPHVHDLRHHFARVMLSSREMTDSEVSKAFGHKDISVTHRVYADIFAELGAEKHRRASDRMDEIFGKQSTAEIINLANRRAA